MNHIYFLVTCKPFFYSSWILSEGGVAFNIQVIIFNNNGVSLELVNSLIV